MAYLGYAQFSDYVMNVRDYANALRDMYNADWAFIVFVADADEGDFGAFEPSQPPCSAPPLVAIAYRPGPMYITNDAPGSFGIGLLDELMRHEQGHLFGASDEVPNARPDCYQAGSCSQGFGYLNASNGNCRYVGYETPPAPPTPVCSTSIICVMQAGDDGLCPSSEIHIGWRDSNANGLPDPIDTTPDLSVTTYPTNPSSSPLLSYQAIAEDIPYPTNHPDFIPVTINNVYVEYKWTNTTTGQSSDWAKAAAGDGDWDSPYEEDFSILICQNGNYNIQLRAVNEVGNISSIAQHTITVNLSSSCETSTLPVVFKGGGSQSPPQSGSPSYSEPYPAPSTPTPPAVAYP